MAILCALWTMRSRIASASVGSPVVAIVQEVSALRIGERRDAPVVQDEEIEPGEEGEPLGERTVCVREGEIRQETAGTRVVDTAPVSTGSLCEGACQVGLADAGWSRDEAVLTVADPLAGGQSEQDGAVQATGLPQVDVLHDGGLAQVGHLESDGEAAVVTVRGFSVDEQAQPLLEGEVGALGQLHLLRMLARRVGLVGHGATRRRCPSGPRLRRYSRPPRLRSPMEPTRRLGEGPIRRKVRSMQGLQSPRQIPLHIIAARNLAHIASTIPGR
jgi:hypothetical protein